MASTRAEIVRDIRTTIASADSPRLLCVRGQAGAGKTFLVETALRGIEHETAVFRARGSATGSPALLPLLSAIVEFEGRRPDDELTALLEEYASSLPIAREIFGPAIRARERTRLGAVAKGGEVPPESFAFLRLSQFFDAVARRQPVMVFVDDLQWLDDASLAFLSYVALERDALDVHVVATARSNGREPKQVELLRASMRGEARHRYREIAVPPLAREEVAEAAARVLGGRVEFTASEIDWLWHRAAGNPLHLGQLLQLLHEGGAIERGAAGWRFRGEPHASAVPESLRETVEARIRTATERVPHGSVLLERASLLGTQFSAFELAAVTGLRVDEVVRQLRRVEEEASLVRRLGPSLEFRFDHDVVRETLAAQLGDLSRYLHREIAASLSALDGMDPARLARHWDAAGEAGTAGALYLAAARESLEKGAFRQARAQASECWRLLRTVSSSTPSSIDTARLVLAETLHGVEAYDEATRVLSEPFQTEARLEVRRRQLMGRAVARAATAESRAKALEWLRSAVELAEATDERALASRIWLDLVVELDGAQRFRASRAAYERAVKLARTAGDDAQLLCRVQRLSCVFWQPARAIEATLGALRLASDRGLHFEAAAACANLGSLYFQLGRLDESSRYSSESVDRLRDLGGYRASLPHNNVALVDVVQGQLDSAIVELQHALSEVLDTHTAIFLRSNLGAALSMAGRPDEASRILGDAVEMARRDGDPYYEHCATMNLARVLIQLGRCAEGADLLRACPVHYPTSDVVLVRGQRAQILLDVAELRGVTPPDRNELVADVEALRHTTKPQAWRHRLPYELTPIEFWED